MCWAAISTLDHHWGLKRCGMSLRVLMQAENKPIVS